MGLKSIDETIALLEDLKKKYGNIQLSNLNELIEFDNLLSQLSNESKTDIPVLIEIFNHSSIDTIRTVLSDLKSCVHTNLMEVD